MKKQSFFSLTSSQSEIWFDQVLRHDIPLYNIGGYVLIDGHIDADRFDQSVNILIKKHDALRLVFDESRAAGELPRQYFLPELSISVPLKDLSNGTNTESAALGWMKIRLMEPYNVFENPLFRYDLVKVSENRYYWLMQYHHLIADGWSIALITRSLANIYSALTRGDDPDLSGLSYVSYLEKEKEYRSSRQYEKDCRYWEKEYHSIPAVLLQPRSNFKSKILTTLGAGHSFYVPRSLYNDLNSLSEQSGVSILHLILGVLYIYFSRTCQQSELVFGIPILNRSNASFRNTAGMFVSVIPVRFDFSSGLSFRSLLTSIAQLLRRSYRHQRLSVSEINRIAGLGAENERSQLFDISVNYAKQSHDALFGDKPARTVTIDNQCGQIPLSVSIWEFNEDEDVQFDFSYNLAYFDHDDVQKLSERFIAILENSLGDIDRPIVDIPLVSMPDIECLMKWNDTTADYPQEKCIHELFEKQVRLSPDVVALVYGEKQLTYKQLNNQSNQLAHYLVTEKQLQPDALVGICLERSFEVMISILGVLKAGGAYVPLDPTYPAARLSYMLEDAALETVITHRRLLVQNPITELQALCLDDTFIQENISRQSSVNITPRELGLSSQHLAYVIYTSGSTGNPKGVMLEHAGICNLVSAQIDRFDVRPDSCVLQFASMTFDAAVSEWAMALCSGSKLVLLPSQEPEALNNTVMRHSVSHATLPPALLPFLDHEAWRNVACIVVAGERCPQELADNWSTNRCFYNAYGPSESTVCTSIGLYDPSQPVLHIGTPINNLCVYVLDERLNLMPVGVVAELYVGGIGLARGYLNRPDLTKEKFIRNPFSDNPNDRLYKTGDLVRWLADGNLEYVGRIDDQVKIRGFRIELGEIENTLLTHPSVSEAVVVAREDSIGDKRLVAYVVADVNYSEVDESVKQIIDRYRQHLSQTLPEYMLPSAFVFLDELPLSPNGKVDRKVLPTPDIRQGQADYLAPITDTEKFLCEIWQDVLGVERVGITDNFFHLGGHSLLATRVIAKVNHRMCVDVPLRALFNSSSVQALALTIGGLDSVAAYPPIERVSRTGPLLLSYAQQRLWFIDQLEQSSVQYNMSASLRLSGRLDDSALQRAFNTVVKRHESLRTVFIDQGNGPLQCIQVAPEFELRVTDLSHLDSDRQDDRVQHASVAEANKAFDLRRDLMLRAQLLKLTDEAHVLLVSMHHIASDGWSVGILLTELSTLYQAYSEGKDSPLSALSIQYADYAHWQRQWLQGDTLNQKVAYWRQQLAALPVVHNVPLDYPRPQKQTFSGARVTQLISKTNVDGLKTLCDAQGATLFMGLHAAFSVLLARYSGENDIVIGSPIANREQVEVESLIGLFVNTLVLRSDLSKAPSFVDLLAQSKQTALDAYAHQQVPFEQLVEVLQPERTLSHSPLCQIMLVLQNNQQSELLLTGLSQSPLVETGVQAKFDLTLNVQEGGHGLSVSWEYNTDLFDACTIERMADHFVILLHNLLARPHDNVHGIDLLSDDERYQQLVTWNDTRVDYLKDRCIHELFEIQAAEHPEAIALIFEEAQLTYGELNRQANQLAHYLVKENNLQPDTLVGICLNRSLEMVIAILGVLKSGGAYVPLDPDYPEARLAYMLEDAGLETVITRHDILERTPIAASRALCVDIPVIQQRLSSQSIDNVDAKKLGLNTRNLAYVIYTSGSTGNPKGVMIEHAAVVRLVTNTNFIDYENTSAIAQASNISFDAATFEIWGALVNGAKLVYVSKFELLNTSELHKKIEKCNIDTLFTTTALFNSVAESDPSCFARLKNVFFGGEECSIRAVRAIANSGKPSRLVHVYGPTENTTFSTWKNLDLETINNQESLAIGEPLNNTTAYVVNDAMTLQPIGVGGELLLGGEGVSRGYLNRSDLTKAKFIKNPFSSDASERLYKTGDLVRWLPDGNLEFIGRIDRQVKIRGFRIELGEIENTLLILELVSEAVVVAQEGMSGKTLVAYVVSNRLSKNLGATADDLIQKCRHHISQKLPEYMWPTVFVVLDILPLTPNGKVDRKALPVPRVNQSKNEYVPPQTETEKVLCDIWQDVLEVDQVGVADNFFRLGGHSLLLMRVLSKLQERGRNAEVSRLFGAATLREQASMLDSELDAVSCGKLDAESQSNYSVFRATPNLIPDPCYHLTPDMLPLINLTQEDLDTIIATVDGGVENIQDIYPLAPLQEGILFHYQMSEIGEDPYVLPALLVAKTRQQRDDFLGALQVVMDRHDALRTAIMWKDLPQAVQVVHRRVNLPIDHFTINPDMDLATQLDNQMEEAQKYLNITKAPLLRIQISEHQQSEQYFILLKLHHIIADHVALEIIQSEINTILQNELASLDAPLGYREFVSHSLHQAERLNYEVFFKEKLKGFSEPTAPFDLLNVHGSGGDIIEASREFPLLLARQTRELSQRLNISPAALFHSAFAWVVGVCSGQDDVVFGTVLSGRLQGTAGADCMLGMFINTLPCRLNLKDMNVESVVKQAQAELLSLLPYEQVSLAKAQQCSEFPSGIPLFTAILNYRHSARNSSDWGKDMGVEVLRAHERTNYPFTVSIDDFGEGFAITAQVNARIDPVRVVGYLQKAMESLIEALSASSVKNILDLSILPSSERKNLLAAGGDSEKYYSHDMCIHEQFEAQVINNPDAVALVFENTQLTYRELNQQANQLAHYLIAEKGVQSDTLVGICLNRSREMVVAILGVLKSGGAYVPLDPTYPEARLRHILNDTQLATVITSREILTDMSVISDQALCLDDDDVQVALKHQSVKDLDRSSTDERSSRLAYVIFTSGSTGKPKGVLTTHQNVTRLFTASESCFDFNEKDIWTLFHSYAFDFSVWELWGALIHGGRLLVIPYWITRSSDDFYQLLVKENVTVLNQTPSAFNLLMAVDEDRQESLALRYVIFGGEQLKPASLRPWMLRRGDKTPQLVNMYGITETTVHVTYHRILLNELMGNQEQSVIGRPLKDLSAWVLTPENQLAPVGVKGELHVGGSGLARGYLNRQDLTAEKFISNPFSDNPNDRLYKTGDLVRWLVDGNLEYVGRIDDQVKIRGFRIELGEIENTILTHPSVSETVVIAREDGAGDKCLVAYVVADVQYSEVDESVKQLIDCYRQHLRQTLPEYMLPSAFVFLDELPLSPNGKVDRKALPTPDIRLGQADYLAPITDTEKSLCEIWQDVLGVERVGITDNFFRLGGHSLLATRVIAKVNRQLCVDVPLKSLFNSSSVQTLALTIDGLDSVAAYPPIESMSDTGPLLLSYAQQRLWFIDQLEQSSVQYNMPASLRLSGSLNVSALQRAFNTVVRRHESLRTVFIDQGKGPFQRIHVSPEFELRVTDLSHLDSDRQEDSVQCASVAEANKTFDLRQDLMLRAQLLKLSEDAHILLVTIHHIASDGWSVGILLTELSALYQAYSEGKDNPLSPLSIQYADYAHWQRQWLQGDALNQKVAYWRQQLAALPVVHNVPLDYPRPKKQTFSGARLTQKIRKTDLEGLNALCDAQGATLFMGLHAAFSVLLARYSGENDIVIGSPIANREQVEVESLIGLFVNTLVLRSDLSDAPSFTDLLGKSKQTALDAYTHQQVPFEQLVEVLQPERSLSHSPLCQIMLVLQNNQQSELRLLGLTLSPLAETGVQAKFDLTLNVEESGHGLSVSWEYNTDLFNARTIERMADNFAILLHNLLARPHDNVHGIGLLSDAERYQQLVTWNATQAEYPEHLCIHELFERQAEEHPESIALIFEETQLTYGELNRQANQLAHYLITEKGVQPETLVGVCMERSLEMVIAILGILKAGGAYVPLDSDYPEERLAYMLEDAGLETVITTLGVLSKTPVTVAQSLCLDDGIVKQQLSYQTVENLLPSTLTLTAKKLAYVIYTSGSSGQPKGVMISHQGLVNLMGDNAERFSIGQKTRFLQNTSISFDAASWVFWMSLSHGASVVVEKEIMADRHYLEALINQKKISHVMMVPSSLSFLEPDHVPNLQCVIVGGDKCPQSLSNKWNEKFSFFNAYGPTENTICSSVKNIVCNETVNIGRIVQNSRAYVLDNLGEPLPIGVVGELHLGGVGLAQGYLNRPEMTAEKFIPNPFDGISNRLYKTGDRVRWLPNGDLEYLGRIDDQVKIRGFRIELGEIENTLLTHPSVSETVVVAREDNVGDKRLVAYVVAEEQCSEADKSVKWLIDRYCQHLGQTLPEYMLPSAFVFLDDLPLSPNGKVDRKVLPAPDMCQGQLDYSAPITDTEKSLCEIWQYVLGVERVSINDNFFRLGGHSLSAVRMIAKVEFELEVRVPVREVFEHTTVEKLALFIDLNLQGNMASTIFPRKKDQLIPLSFVQKSYWFLYQLEDGSATYNSALTLRLKGVVNIDALEKSFQTLISRHENLRTRLVLIESDPYQVVDAISPWVLPLVNTHARDVTDLVRQEATRVFILDQEPAFRVKLFCLGNNENVLSIVSHHTVMDGWSMDILLRELAQLYDTFCFGVDSELPPLPIQYGDYAVWQQQTFMGEIYQTQCAYWKEKLNGLAPLIDLPTDYTRPPMQSYCGDSCEIVIPALLSKALSSYASSQGVTLFHVVLSGMAILLSRYTRTTDIPLGTAIANRPQPVLEELVGCFVNTVVLRCEVSRDEDFNTIVQQVKDTALDAFSHADVPFDSVVDAVNPERSLGVPPIFQVMFRLHNQARGEGVELTGLEIEPFPFSSQSTVELDLNVSLMETAEGIRGEFAYATDLFCKETIQRFIRHYVQLLTEAMKTPTQAVGLLGFLSEHEQRQLSCWNDTTMAYPEDECIHTLFEASAARLPEKSAYICGEERYSYASLNAKANQMAHWLRDQGVGPEVRVGVCVGRSAWMGLSLLAVLKSGGTYVPLDPAYPKEHLGHMLAVAKPTVILTEQLLVERLPESSAQFVCVDQGDERWAEASTDNPTHLTGAEHSAYILFTSGSTGKPKGILVAHKSLRNMPLAHSHWNLLSEKSRILQFASLSFSISIWNSFMAWVAGATLYQVTEEESLPGDALYQLIEREQITTATWPVSVLCALPIDHIAKSLQIIISSAEPCNDEVVLRWAEGGRRFLNMYGNTEVSIGSTLYEYQQSGQRLSIGRAFPNTTMYLLDKQLQPVPVGVVAEIYTGGIGLAKGYVNQPEETREKFIQNPFSNTAEERLYKTGDLGRYLSNGEIEFIGRDDFQVNIRGFRIELAEVEGVLRSHDAIDEVVVVTNKDHQGIDQLVCFYVIKNCSASRGDLTAQSLRTLVADRLPNYMIPAIFVSLDEMPLTPNRKVDRLALSASTVDRIDQAEYEASETETQRILCDIYRDMLDVERIGLSDNFFHLGGNSLLATKLLVKVNDVLGIKLTIREVFSCENIRMMSELIDRYLLLKQKELLSKETEGEAELSW